MAGALEVAMNLLKNLDSIERAFPFRETRPLLAVLNRISAASAVYLHIFVYMQQQGKSMPAWNSNSGTRGLQSAAKTFAPN
jgi:hypothetical protein